MIALRDKVQHTRRRRPWTRAFSTVALKGYENMITNRCVQLVEAVGQQNGVVDMAKWISYFTYVPVLPVQTAIFRRFQIRYHERLGVGFFFDPSFITLDRSERWHQFRRRYRNDERGRCQRTVASPRSWTNVTKIKTSNFKLQDR